MAFSTMLRAACAYTLAEAHMESGVMAGVHDSDEAMSLLQLSKKMKTSFGCSGGGDAASIWKCGEWGDPHRFVSWNGGMKNDNTMQMGWHWLAKSKDGQLKVQVFLQAYCLDGCAPFVGAVAGQMGGDTFKIVRKEGTTRLSATEDSFKLIVNGEEQPDAPTKDFPSGFHVEPQAIQPGNHLHRWTNRVGRAINVHVCMDSADKRFTFRQHGIWLEAKQVPMQLEVIANADDIDQDFPSFCTREEHNVAYHVDPADLLVTAEEAALLCQQFDIPEADCQNPPPLPPPPSDEDMCRQNGVSYTDAVATCESERGRGHGMFEGCVQDCCQGADVNACALAAEEFDDLADADVDDTASAADDPHIKTYNGKKFDMS